MISLVYFSILVTKLYHSANTFDVSKAKNMNNFENKTAVITGGNSGIGYEAAKALKEQGANVFITGRRREAVETAANTLGVFSVVADQANIADTDKLVQEVTSKNGKIDILFINAGISTLSPIEQATEAHFDEMMDINFKGAYFTLSRFIPHLNDGASVIFLSSIVAQTYAAGSSVYSASKAALNAIMKTAALELAPRRIRVNAISPGPITTPIMQKAGLDEATLQSIYQHILGKMPLQRLGSPMDIAGLVTYLASDSASFITGSEFVIDGGFLLS